MKRRLSLQFSVISDFGIGIFAGVQALAFLAGVRIIGAVGMFFNSDRRWGV
jgi:hypothetical protein